MISLWKWQWRQSPPWGNDRYVVRNELRNLWISGIYRWWRTNGATDPIRMRQRLSALRKHGWQESVLVSIWAEWGNDRWYSPIGSNPICSDKMVARYANGRTSTTPKRTIVYRGNRVVSTPIICDGGDGISFPRLGLPHRSVSKTSRYFIDISMLFWYHYVNGNDTINHIAGGTKWMMYERSRFPHTKLVKQNLLITQPVWDGKILSNAWNTWAISWKSMDVHGGMELRFGLNKSRDLMVPINLGHLHNTKSN